MPTLVEMPSGEIVYGLGPADFQLTDNGVPQQLHVDDDLDSEPVSVVVQWKKAAWRRWSLKRSIDWLP